jgi:glucosylglycerol-phosphate synthase
MPSSFVLVYHRSPFDEVIDHAGQRHWRDQQSPNGIIPTLRNLFRSQPSGTWIAWREDAADAAQDETMMVRAVDSLSVTVWAEEQLRPIQPDKPAHCR